MLPENQQEQFFRQEQARVALLTEGAMVQVYRGGVGLMLMKIYAIHRDLPISSNSSYGYHTCTLYQLEDAAGTRNYYTTADFIGLAPKLG